MKFNLCLMQPYGYIHGLALLETMEYCAEKINACGHESVLCKNRLIRDGINIVFGAHIDPKNHTDLPKNIVIFNTEQLPMNGVWTSDEYRKILGSNFVWDYTVSNLSLIPHENKALISLLYNKNLLRISHNQHRDWDVLFYGSINEQRKNVLESLSFRGLRVKTLFGVYGAERDYFISRSRAVLNLHFYESRILQQVRVFYPLINRVPVISEDFLTSSAPKVYETCLFTPQGRGLTDYVVSLLADDNLFQELAASKISEFEATAGDDQFVDSLRSTIQYFDSIFLSFHQPFLVEKINLGSGKDYRFGYLNIDIKKDVLPDVLLDLSEKINFPVKCESNVYGSITLNANQIDEIVAIDVLEHVNDLETLMGNCLKLLKVGGRFVITVPYDLSEGAWQDPTHVRAFNQNSWMYYTDWFWYLGWFRYRFEVIDIKFVLSQFGEQLAHKNTNQASLLNMPRAIDEMNVVLVKRETSPEERGLARAYSSKLIFQSMSIE